MPISTNNEDLMYRLLVQNVMDYAIYMLTPEGIVCNWNAGAERAKGYTAAEIVGEHFSRFYMQADRDRGMPQRALATALKQGKFEGEGWRLRKDGSKFWAHVVIDRLCDENGTLIGFAKITRDVTERRKIEEQVSHLAHHDTLTSLLNRAAFRLSLERAMMRRHSGVLLSLNLDRFKSINESLGHLVGDTVLQTVAERITSQLRRTDIGGRLGGDEFAVMLMDCTDGAAASAASERLIREIEKPITIDGTTISVGVSVGMAFAGDAAHNMETLLRNVDLALHTAKSEKRGTYRWYDTNMQSLLVQRQALETDLRRALQQNEFALHYQPVIDAKRYAVKGYEALIRWESPTRGKVSPGEFIPFAEEHGMMIEIGEWVLRTACATAARWSQNLCVFINLSPVQFSSTNIVERIARILSETGLPPERLELEITETAMMRDVPAAKLILDSLRSMGVRVAMDDFGTGYSSLSFLRMLPFTRIKIDKSFIQDLGKTQESLAIVRAVAGLCGSLGLAVTAEGVETEEQRRILEREGCDDLQGYLLGRPAASPEWNGQHADPTLHSHAGALPTDAKFAVPALVSE